MQNVSVCNNLKCLTIQALLKRPCPNSPTSKQNSAMHICKSKKKKVITPEYNYKHSYVKNKEWKNKEK